MHSSSTYFFNFIYLFLERGEGREKERERNIDVREKHQLLAPRMCPNQDWTPKLGMCPDQELNWWPLALQNNTQLTEPRRSGPSSIYWEHPVCPRHWARWCQEPVVQWWRSQTTHVPVMTTCRSKCHDRMDIGPYRVQRTMEWTQTLGNTGAGQGFKRARQQRKVYRWKSKICSGSSQRSVWKEGRVREGDRIQTMKGYEDQWRVLGRQLTYSGLYLRSFTQRAE